jgi:hypothetical protein
LSVTLNWLRIISTSPKQVMALALQVWISCVVDLVEVSSACLCFHFPLEVVLIIGSFVLVPASYRLLIIYCVVLVPVGILVVFLFLEHGGIRSMFFVRSVLRLRHRYVVFFFSYYFLCKYMILGSVLCQVFLLRV